MRYFIVLFAVFAFALVPQLTMAKKGGNSSASKGKGPHPNSSAYEHASDKAKFNREGEWQGGKKSYYEEEYEAEYEGKKIKSKKKIKEDDERYRVRDEIKMEKRVEERYRVEDGVSSDKSRREKSKREIRERILHRDDVRED